MLAIGLLLQSICVSADLKYIENIEQAFAQIKSTVTLLKLDKKNKQAKVKQSYWADCY